MKALIFNKPGEPKDVLELKEISKPIPGPNEVLIKVLASPIHPADYMFIQGKYRYKPEFPQTAGLEGAGIIEAIGENVKLKTGTLAAFTSRKSWAEYIVLSEKEIVVLPDNFPIEKAAQFCLNPFTAWGLLDELNLKEGDWILITAGNSTVSKIIIQLAKLSNINVISVIRDMNQADELKSLGANAVLKMEEDDFIEKVNDITNGNGINGALDAVGGKIGTMILQSMAQFGRIIIYGLLNEEPAQYHNSQIVFKNLLIKGFGVRTYLQNQTDEQREEMIKTLIKEIGKDSFQLPVEKTLRFDQFKEALQADSRKNKKGKVILRN